MSGIALLGDVMLGRGVGERLAKVAPEDLWAPELRELLSGCDAVICNLECCISSRGRPTVLMPGKPYLFRAPPSAIRALQAIGATVAGLGNNHVLDFDAVALVDTLAHLRRAGISYCGAGHDEESARRGAAVQVAGHRIGVVAFSNHPVEFAARPRTPGIAYDELVRGIPQWLRVEIARLRESCDLVVAFPHWGPNMTVEPARWQRAVADELLAAGADLVAGHSSHVFHGLAFRPGGPVLYDLGDVIDDYATDPQLRNDRGVLAIWRPGEEPELELVALRLHYCYTEIARGEDAEWIAARLEHACGRFGTVVRRTDEARFAAVTGLSSGGGAVRGA